MKHVGELALFSSRSMGEKAAEGKGEASVINGHSSRSLIGGKPSRRMVVRATHSFLSPGSSALGHSRGVAFREAKSAV